MSNHTDIQAAPSPGPAPSPESPHLSLSGCSSLFSMASTVGLDAPGGGGRPPSPVTLGIAYGDNEGELQLQLAGSCSAGDGDRRTIRMMKNRESALRSRARKRAYVQELENEVSRLVNENSNLKKQCKELKLAMAAQILPTKRSLRRTTSARF